MPKYIIYWGIGGGYGGMRDAAIVEWDNLGEAINDAYDRAAVECETEGLTNTEEYYEAETEEERLSIWYEEVDRWAVYDAEEYSEKAENEWGESIDDETNFI